MEEVLENAKILKKSDKWKDANISRRLCKEDREKIKELMIAAREKYHQRTAEGKNHFYTK